MEGLDNEAGAARAGIVLVLGSAPAAVAARDWPRAPFDAVVAINNAWRIRPDWDHVIYSEDFPEANRPPPGTGGAHVTYREFVPCQNRFGGVIYAGGTMAFTTGYWVLGALRPRVMAFLGCDMVYPKRGPTHFYGTGAADPLRQDVTLRSLEAKSARLWLQAAVQGCHCVNLSTAESRLLFPRASRSSLPVLAARPAGIARAALAPGEVRERLLDYRYPSGRYWEIAETLDPAEIDRVDRLWLDAFHRVQAAGEADRIAL